MRTYLTVPAEDESLAVTLGAIRDPECGQFFAPTGANLGPFEPWLAAATASRAIGISTEGISLTELLSRASSAINQAFPRPEWVRIEISSLAIKNGYMALDAVDRDPSGMELSKARAFIWRAYADKIGERFFKATGTRLADGMKVLVLVETQFKEQYGLSLNIVDVDPRFTLGDMEARLRRIREKLEADGDALKNRSLPSPLDFSNVAVISPDGAAGLGDFQAEADRLTSMGLCNFTYFHAVFQGEKAKDALRDAFIKAHKTHEIDPFDALVVIRGGGAATDLHWLNEYLLAKMVCRFHAPVFIGIGHERDSTILDEHAHRSFGTPSKVIAHIKEVIATRANKALEDWTAICQFVGTRLSAAEARIEQRRTEVGVGASKRLDQATFRASTSYSEVQNNALAALSVASEKANSLHTTVVKSAASTLDVAIANADHLISTINDRSLNAVHRIEVNTNHDFDAITLAARRSIDGIQEHLNTYWIGILRSADTTTKDLAEVGSRNFSDVQYYAKKMISAAEESSEELMLGIFAHGVEPTLRRGFAIVKSDGKPISTKAAALTQQSLEIVFKDGSLRVTKMEE
jgi:exodeoxyribonuclease VII large subunit